MGADPTGSFRKVARNQKISDTAGTPKLRSVIFDRFAAFLCAILRSTGSRCAIVGYRDCVLCANRVSANLSVRDDLAIGRSFCGFERIGRGGREERSCR